MDLEDISIEQKEYIETKSGAGVATSSRIICEYCDKESHNECKIISKCYCAKDGLDVIRKLATLSNYDVKDDCDAQLIRIKEGLVYLLNMFLELWLETYYP